MVSRVGTYGQAMNNINNNRLIMHKIDKAYLQSQTGKKSDLYLGISKQTKDLLSFEAELGQSNEYLTNIKDIKSRLNEADRSLEQIYNRVVDFRKQLVSASNDKDFDNFPISQKARDLYNEIAQYLNKEYQGFFLFGGTDVQNPPIRTFDETVDTMSKLFTPSTQAGGVGDVSNFTNIHNGLRHPVPGTDGTGGLSSCLAPSNAASNTNGMPIRIMQIIDFFSNDQAYGSLLGTVRTGSTIGYGVGEDRGGNFPDPIPGEGNTGGAGGIINPPLADDMQIARGVITLDFSALYYKGNKQKLTIDISNTANLEYGITGSEQGFEQVMKGLFILGSFGEGINDEIDEISLEDRVDCALQLLEDALKNSDRVQNKGDNLANIRFHIGSDMARLDTAKISKTNELTFLKETIAEIENVDITEVAVQLQEQITLIQASFSAYAKVSQLSLASFLR